MKIYFLTFILIFVSLFQSCQITDPRKEDFVGSWKSDDGASFIFLNDGTFKAEMVSGEKMFENFEPKNIRHNENGSWVIKRKDDRWEIQLIFNKSKTLNVNFITQLYVGGTKGIASNKPPWYLYKYIGDPDDGAMYNFYKVPKSF
jgi:hypothetical protein